MYILRTAKFRWRSDNRYSLYTILNECGVRYNDDEAVSINAQSTRESRVVRGQSQEGTSGPIQHRFLPHLEGPTHPGDPISGAPIARLAHTKSKKDAVRRRRPGPYPCLRVDASRKHASPLRLRESGRQFCVRQSDLATDRIIASK